MASTAVFRASVAPAALVERSELATASRASTTTTGAKTVSNRDATGFRPHGTLAGSCDNAMATTEPGPSSPRSRPPRALGSIPRLVSLPETAQTLGMSPASVRRLIWQGRLRPVRITRRIQFDLRDIEALIERSKGLGEM